MFNIPNRFNNNGFSINKSVYLSFIIMILYKES